MERQHPDYTDDLVYAEKRNANENTLPSLDITVLSNDSEVNYSRHQALVDSVEYYKVHQTKPWAEREDVAGWGYKYELRKLGSRFIARKLTRDAEQALSDHNALIKEAYRPYSPASLSAIDEAVIEDREREADVILGMMVNDFESELNQAMQNQDFEALDGFGKLDFIRKYAIELVFNQKVPHITTDSGTVTIFGHSVEKVTNQPGGPYMAVPVAVKLSQPSTEIIKLEYFKTESADLEGHPEKYAIHNDCMGLLQATLSGDRTQVRRNGLTLAFKDMFNLKNEAAVLNTTVMALRSDDYRNGQAFNTVNVKSTSKAGTEHNPTDGWCTDILFGVL